MLDIAVIRENPDRVKELCAQKNVDVDVDHIVGLDDSASPCCTKSKR